MAGAALYATESLVLGDRVTMTDLAPIANAGAQTTDLGASVRLGNVVSVGPVALRSHAAVLGNLTTARTLSRQDGTQVLGKVSERATVSLPGLDWQYTFPPRDSGPISLEPGQSRFIEPGAYLQVSVKRDAHLTLQTGTYDFDSLLLDAGSFLDLDQAGVAASPTTSSAWRWSSPAGTAVVKVWSMSGTGV